MKYAPEKVFIKENDTYVEISYQEFCRKQNNEFKDKFFISLHNMLMEVDEAYYTEFYREQRREKYLRERAVEKGDIYYHSLDTEEFCGEDILVDPDEDVAQQITDKLMAEHIRYIVSLLPEDERELIEALFFNGYSERQWSRISGIPQRTICYRKNVILQKLKKILKN